MYEEARATINECFVYKVPPRARAEGYKAADWNLNESIWNGKVSVKSKGPVCIVKLEGNDGVLFAQCQWDQTQGQPAVEKVLDSSRYFVLRIEHQGRHAYIGLGFNERSSAFDFNVAITDHKRDLEREVEVERLKQQAQNEPQLDFSFKEGEKIKINVQAKAADGSGRSRRRAAGQQVQSLGGGMLAPPPQAKTSIHKRGQSGSGQAQMFQQQQQPQQPQPQQGFNNQQMFPPQNTNGQQQQQQQQQMFPPSGGNNNTNSNWFA